MNDHANAMDASPFLSKSAATCPADLIRRAQPDGQAMRLAVVRASAPLPLTSARAAAEAGIATPILIGEADDIRRHAETIGWQLDDTRIIDTDGEKAAVEAATSLVREGEADALMKGQLHTDVFMAGIIARDAGIRIGRRMVHIFALFPPEGGKPLLISDGAVNVTPDMETRKEMILAMTRLLHGLGRSRPKIAILSATETPIPSVPSSMEAQALAQWASHHVEAADISGPLSLDLAIAPEAVAIKGMQADHVAGAADGIIVPDINTGNVLFKALVWFRSACAAGIVEGGRVPIILTSRADPPAARTASIALAAISHRTTSQRTDSKETT